MSVKQLTDKELLKLLQDWIEDPTLYSLDFYDWQHNKVGYMVSFSNDGDMLKLTEHAKGEGDDQRIVFRLPIFPAVYSLDRCQSLFRAITSMTEKKNGGKVNILRTEIENSEVAFGPGYDQTGYVPLLTRQNFGTMSNMALGQVGKDFRLCYNHALGFNDDAIEFATDQIQTIANSIVVFEEVCDRLRLKGFDLEPF